ARAPRPPPDVPDRCVLPLHRPAALHRRRHGPPRQPDDRLRAAADPGRRDADRQAARLDGDGEPAAPPSHPRRDGDRRRAERRGQHDDARVQAHPAPAAMSALDACLDKMRTEGLPEVAVETFAHYWRALEAGETGLIAESDIEPVASLPDADDL